MEIVRFNKNIADMQAIVESTKNILSVDVSNEKELEAFKEKQKVLQKLRTGTKDEGLSYREEANMYIKNVLSLEKSLLAIIVPEEDRLKAILEEAEHAEFVKIRKEMTPFRVKTMKERGLSETQFPTNLEELDSNEFEAYVSLKVAENNEAELAKLREEKEKRDKEDAQKQREQDMKDAAESARLAEIDRQEKEKADAILAEKAQAEKLNKEKAYLEWRVEKGWTPTTREDYKQETIGGEVILWKKIGVYKI